MLVLASLLEALFGIISSPYPKIITLNDLFVVTSIMYYKLEINMGEMVLIAIELDYSGTALTKII